MRTVQVRWEHAHEPSDVRVRVALKRAARARSTPLPGLDGGIRPAALFEREDIGEAIGVDVGKGEQSSRQ